MVNVRINLSTCRQILFHINERQRVDGRIGVGLIASSYVCSTFCTLFQSNPILDIHISGIPRGLR